MTERNQPRVRKRSDPGKVAARRASRRQAVAETAVAIIVRDGLDGLTLRAIAAEMNCTTGVLTNQFRNKADLISAVLDHQHDILFKRLDNTEMLLDADPLVGLMWGLLPLDDEMRSWWRVFMAFTGASINQPSLEPSQEQRETMVRDRLTQLFSFLQTTNDYPADRDPMLEADIFISVIDGLAIQLMLAPKHFDEKRCEAIVARYRTLFERA